jgi:hypothetical protein
MSFITERGFYVSSGGKLNKQEGGCTCSSSRAIA